MQKTKRIVSFLITLCMLMAFVPTHMAYAESAFSGRGTEDDPYIIANAADFIQLATDVNGGISYSGTYFKVSDNVTEPIVLTTDGGFAPIGTVSAIFEGTFDGNGKTVQLNLDLSTDYVGLFGFCGSSVIKNVTTTGTVTGKGNVGGIAGYSLGNIINCYNQADVTGTNSYVGGIIGFNYNYVINCSNSGKVTGSTIVGGISGGMNSYLVNCLNTGTVTGGQYTGGIAGYAWELGITNCVNNGEVKKADGSKYAVGGIAGMRKSGASITNCYYNSTINEGVCDAGYGENDTAVTTTDCGKSGDEIVSDAVLEKLNIYARDNTANGTALLYWKAADGVISFTSEAPSLPYTITKNSAYISVADNARSGSTVTITVSAPSGIVVTGVTVKDADNADVETAKTTETSYTFTMPDSNVTVSATADINLTLTDGVYQIGSADEMKILSDAVNAGYDTTDKSFKLTSDVSLSTEGGFAPIGKASAMFNGTFDGNGKTVQLNLDLSTINNVGLFGFCGNSSVIKNVTTTGTVKGGGCVGGIAGMMGGEIINCHNQAAVTGTNSYVGGITGYDSKYVINCSNSGEVTGLKRVGGISGNMSTAYLINCLNNGTVTGGQYTGGIAGYAWSYDITNCVNNGEVKKATGSEYAVGGIAGLCHSSVKLTNCYYNNTKNAGIYYAGYDENGTAVTTTDGAKSGDEIVSNAVLDTLNLYARENTPNGTALLYWKVADGGILLTYTITNNSADYITVVDNARSGSTVTITKNVPSYMTIKEISVKGADNADISVNTTETGYNFTMPDSNVTVSVSTDINLTLTDGVYQIGSADEMKILSDAVNAGYDTTDKSFKLTDNVSLSTAGSFAPIGTKDHSFNGTFDGNDKTVELNLDLSTDYVGLFGYCSSSSVIKNVTTTGSVTGASYVGGIAGYANGKIINCTNNAAVTATASCVGGITGQNGYIINCQNQAAVTGPSFVGGIAGTDAEVTNCLNTGTVTGGNFTGGIGGMPYSLANCVNNGAVKANGNASVSGIAGKVSNGNPTTCYYNSTINKDICGVGNDNTTNDYAKSGDEIVSDAVIDELNLYARDNTPFGTALLYWKAAEGGISFTSVTPSFSYAITNNSSILSVAKQAKSGESVEITVGEVPSYMKLVKITVNDTELSANDEGKYVFTMPAENVTVDAETEINLTKLEDYSYKISTPEELVLFANAVNSGDFSDAYATLTADITVSTADGFESIGTQSNPYSGYFYGEGHTLTLNITEGTAYGETTATGLFGAVKGASIYNLILKGSVDGGDKTDSYTGALIGAVIDREPYVYSVYSEAAVSGSGYVGGIVGGYVGGGNQYVSLKNVINNGTVAQKNTADDKKAVGAIMGAGSVDYINVFYNSEKNSGMYDRGYDDSFDKVTSNYYTDMARTTAELFADEVIDALNGYALDRRYMMFWDVSADTQAVKLVEKCPVKLYDIKITDEMSDSCIDTFDYSRAGRTVTVKAALYYDFDGIVKDINGIKVTDSKGTVIDVTKTGDDTYEFVMPEGYVNIQAVFEYNITKDSDGVYYIADEQDLYIFSLIVEGGQTDANAKVLAKELYIGGELNSDGSDSPDGLIGQNTAYTGTFDGNGSQISWVGALFGNTDGAVIKNINIDTSYSGEYFAGVVKSAKNTCIDNCNAVIKSSAWVAAGIAYEAQDSQITNCSVTASGSAGYFGGIVGLSDSTVIANCVLNESTISTRYNYGGIVYYANGETKIYNCVNQDRFDMYGAGAIVGLADMSTLTLENNFYYKSNGCYDVFCDNETGETIGSMTDKNSAVDDEDVAALYIPGKLNEYIDENPELIEGTALNKWSCVMPMGACFAVRNYPEIYSIKRSGVNVNTLVNGKNFYGMAAGATVTISGVPSDATVSVTADDGTPIELSDDGTFKMPKCAVTVSVVMDSGIEETTEIDGKTYVVVKNAEDFIKAVKSIAAGNNILNVYIAEDISLTSTDLANYPVYDDSTPAYNGTFEGAGHTVTFDGAPSAILSTIGKNGVVKNLTVDGTVGAQSEYAAAVAYVNNGIIINCINKADITATNASGIAANNSGTIVNCINKGDINGSSSAAIAYSNSGDVGFVANEGAISNPTENGSMIASGSNPSGGIDLSAEADKSVWGNTAANVNSSLEQAKAYLQLVNDCREWSVSITDTKAEFVFADEKNAPYYICTTPGGDKPYKAGEVVEVEFDTSKLEAGFEIGSVTVQAVYADEIFNASPVADKENTFSFKMPGKTCKTVMNTVPKDIEKDENGYYLVDSLDDLIKVKKTIENGNNDINIKLTADIETYNGEPISGDYGYDGIFDGNGHSITLAISSENDLNKYGLFTKLKSNAVVKNLTINGSIKSEAQYAFVGAVAGESEGTITDCVNNASVEGYYAGGIVGYISGVKNNPAKLTNCENNGDVTGYDAGGIVYEIDDYGVITNCVNNGDVEASDDDAGGIAAQGGNVEIINSINNGAVSGYCAGGIIGSTWNNSVINNCINNGDVDAYDSTGGIVGYGEDNTTIKNCYNSGNITCDDDVYAIAYRKDGSVVILNSFYLQTDKINTGLESSNVESRKDSSEAVAEADVASGYVAAKLNSGVTDGLNRWNVEDGKLVFADEDTPDSELYYEIITVGIGGTVKADKTFAKAGETITLTMTPKKEGQTALVMGVELDENNSFVMGEKTVNVYVTFGDTFTGTEKSDVIEIMQNAKMEEVKLADYVKFENDSLTRDFTFALAEGSVLPDGLSLTDGKISGTPTQVGEYTVVFDVTDSGEESAASLMSLDPDRAQGSAQLTLTFKVVEERAYITKDYDVGKFNQAIRYSVPKGTDYVLIVAKYNDDGSLASIETTTSDEDQNDGILVVKSDENVKIMLWNSLDEMSPLCESYEVK